MVRAEEVSHHLDEITIDDIECIALSLEDIEGDCDLISDTISHLLEIELVQHLRMTGMAIHKQTGERVYPHCWIELEGGQIVDVRLRRWLGDRDEIPHGIVHKNDSLIEYRGALDTRKRMSKKDIQLFSGYSIS